MKSKREVVLNWKCSDLCQHWSVLIEIDAVEVAIHSILSLSPSHSTPLLPWRPSSEDVASLVLHLVLFEHEEEAKQLQSAFEVLLTVAEKKIATIWPAEGNVAMATGHLHSVSCVFGKWH